MAVFAGGWTSYGKVEGLIGGIDILPLMAVLTLARGAHIDAALMAAAASDQTMTTEQREVIVGNARA